MPISISLMLYIFIMKLKVHNILFVYALNKGISLFGPKPVWPGGPTGWTGDPLNRLLDRVN